MTKRCAESGILPPGKIQPDTSLTITFLVFYFTEPAKRRCIRRRRTRSSAKSRFNGETRSDFRTLFRCWIVDGPRVREPSDVSILHYRLTYGVAYSIWHGPRGRREPERFRRAPKGLSSNGISYPRIACRDESFTSVEHYPA